MKETLDFVVIGAQKAGTTSLFEYLRRHPELTLPVAKELPYFSSPDVISRGWEDYMRKSFAFADPGSRWGTVTPQYMVGGLLEHPNPDATGASYDERTVPKAIHARAPDARVVAILRDPVDRARSHHRMTLMEGIEQRRFEQAIAELLRPEALADARRQPRETTGYIAWGEYARILGPYYAVFAREQILVVFTEDLERDPQSLLRRMFAFLGVDDDFVPDNLGTKYRVGGGERRFSWLGTYSSLNPLALQRALTRNALSRRLWHALPESARRGIDGLFRALLYRLDLWNRRSESDAQEDPGGATLELLREHFSREDERLASLLGFPPPWHDSVAAR